MKKTFYLSFAVTMGLMFVYSRLTFSNLNSNEESIERYDIKAKLETNPVFTSRKPKKSFPKQEVRHVVFLKVHKTASSSTQNIFLRFGDTRNLTFVLAHTHGESKWSNVISFKNSITRNNIVPPPVNKEYDILCCHVIYNRSRFQQVLPHDTVYIGIVREPFSRFQSAVRMWKPSFILKAAKTQPITTYAQNPLQYEPQNPTLSWTNNRMALEFGFPLELFPAKSHNQSMTEDINSYINHIDREFSFIIITERYEESMVYMRRLLGWKTKDILYEVKFKNKGAITVNENVTEIDRKLLKNFLYLDIALYNFAFQRFEKQIRKEGKSFQEEVSYFKDINAKVANFCKEKSGQDYIQFNKTKWDENFNVTKLDCKLISMKELDFIRRVRFRQYGTFEN